MTDVKICGLKTPETVDAALAGRARYLGFMVFERSPRHIAPAAAAPLAVRARGRADVVAVTVDPADALLDEIAAAFAPDWIQLHGTESPARVGALRRLARKGVIKAFAIARAEDFVTVEAYAPVADLFLFDAKAPPGADRPGGHGAAFDWKLLAGRRFSRPWMLSGGLNPENVANAINLSGAPAVDVSSGVESAPGIKDASRIAAFLAAANPA
jgi:phosphoribosylanthranilate isomerase